jgi:hypothetical protein
MQAQAKGQEKEQINKGNMLTNVNGGELRVRVRVRVRILKTVRSGVRVGFPT